MVKNYCFNGRESVISTLEKLDVGIQRVKGRVTLFRPKNILFLFP